MMESLPPATSLFAAAFIAGAIASSSLLTSIRIAWNVRFAGCGPSAHALAKMADLIMSESSAWYLYHRRNL